VAYDDDVDGVMMRDDIVPRALTSMCARRASIFAVSTSDTRRGLSFFFLAVCVND